MARTKVGTEVYLDLNIMAHYDVGVRTTLTLDDDVAEALRERARLLDKPFKQVVNDALRRGMSPAVSEAPASEYRVAPNRSGLLPGVDPLKLKRLNDFSRFPGVRWRNPR